MLWKTNSKFGGLPTFAHAHYPEPHAMSSHAVIVGMFDHTRWVTELIECADLNSSCGLFTEKGEHVHLSVCLNLCVALCMT